MKWEIRISSYLILFIKLTESSSFMILASPYLYKLKLRSFKVALGLYVLQKAYLAKHKHLYKKCMVRRET